ncbi:MAG: c-type cytochrome domain-containing protein [Pirellula staleyi]
MLRNTVLAATILLFTGFWVSQVAMADNRVDSSLATDVYAILKRSCFECHGPARQDGGLRLDSRKKIADGGDSGTPLDSKDT